MAISYECPKCRNLVDADDYYSSCPMCGEVLSVFLGDHIVPHVILNVNG